MKKNIYFPCEIGHREFPGRFLLASQLAKNNWVVVIGHKNAVDKIVPQLGAGIYVMKDTAGPTAARLANALYHGCIVGAIDEELLDVHSICPPGADAATIDYHLTKGYLDIANFYIASNKFSVNFAEFKGFATTSQLPSLRPLYAMSHYRTPEELGRDTPEFLLPTHMGTINSVSIADLMLISSRSRDLGMLDLLDEQIKNIQIDKVNLSNLLEVLKIFEKQRYKCTVRPHPGEFVEIYKLLERHFAAPIKIDVGTYPVINRNAANVTVVSQSCSTLVEAALSGRGVVCLGADRELFLSSKAVTPVSIQEISGNTLARSPVDFAMLRSELLIDDLSVREGLQKWVDFFESISLPSKNHNISKVKVPILGLSPFMRRRIGALSRDLIASYFSDDFFYDSESMNVMGSEDVVLVSGKD
jgi:surface carbohydrate biosynthesis protein